jgi:phosphoribosylglycinamide formyltransferase-1
MKLAAFASGRGSNVAAILDRIDDGQLEGVEPVLLITNNSRCGAVELARARGIPVRHLSSRTHGEGAALARAMLEALRSAGAQLIVLAGYMKKVPDEVVRAYRGRILNIHPALLPSHGGRDMYGLWVHKAVLAAGERETGVSVHLVDEEYDHGAVLRQSRVPVLPGDTPESLAARVLQSEHELYWRVIRDFVRGRL